MLLIGYICSCVMGIKKLFPPFWRKQLQTFLLVVKCRFSVITFEQQQCRQQQCQRQ